LDFSYADKFDINYFFCLIKAFIKEFIVKYEEKREYILFINKSKNFKNEVFKNRPKNVD